MEQYEFQDSKEESPFPHLLAASYGSSFAKSANKPEKNKKCGVCGKHARTPSDLLRHLRVHTGERPFPCVACDKSFKCKRSQLTHQYLSHGLSEGLSQHRIDTLDRRPGRASSAKTVQQVPSIMEKLIQESLLARQQQQPPPTIPDQPLRASPPPQVDQDEDTEILEGGGGGGPLSFEGVLKEEPREVEQQQVVDQPPKVPVLRIKTHKCTHCKRQFRSVYTLRYHLRSMHDEKVYLSPALESRLKRRRWVPPHVRLSRKKLRMLATAHHQAREKKQEAPPAVEIKKERQDEEEEDINNNEGGGGGGKTPFVPHIFFPSGEEGLEQPVSWESLQATAECMLISKLEAVHPATQQKYVLYKCGVCGKAFASLRAACGHLALNHDVGRGRDCEKCGASFAWGGDLDAHLACHKPPPLPSYLINPFPPAAPPTLERMPHLPYPFFPVPQPGFFPFFLQPQQVAPEESVEEKVGQTFQCKLCPKTFDRIFSLQRHERIHSGQKACFCKVCGRGFSELRNLRHHIVRFHAESSQPLPYRRRPNRSSQRLVSFLKKTAVRILNSISSKEKKEDPVPPPPEQNASMPQLQEAASLPPPTTDTTTPPKLSPSATEGATVEVLRDPKRSLLGNRRKGRPFKLTPHPPEPLLFPPQGGATTLSESTLLQATEILNSLKPELSFPQLSSFFGLQPPPNEEPIDMRNPACVKREAEVEPPPPPTPAFPDNNNMGGLFEGGGKDGVDGGRLFPCSYCHKSFNSITDINRHMSFHADIRPFKCPYCSYCSRTNSQLKVHMMRHEGIKHYMCQICNYNGVTQSDLNRHLKTRTHLLRSRNVCPCCGTGFHTRSLSEEHARSCHQQGAAPTTGAAEKGGSRVTRLKQFNPSGAGAELFQKLLKQQQQ